MKKKIAIGLSIFIGVYILLQVLPYPGYTGESKFKIEDGQAPLVIAHGGAKLLYPENTQMAFDESYAMGVDVLETDLCLTSDGILVTHHNMTVDATSNHTGYVHDYSFSQLKEMNFGYHFEDLQGDFPYRDETDPNILSTLVPMSIEELFQTYGTNVLYIMEIKDAGENGIVAANHLNEMIEKYGLEEYVSVASFHTEPMEHFVEIKDERVNIAMDLSTATDFVIANYVGYGMFTQFEHAGLMLPPSFSGIPLDIGYLAYKVNHNNMFLHYWTINDKEEMRKLIELGADGLITDRPDLMFEVLEELGYE